MTEASSHQSRTFVVLEHARRRLVEVVRDSNFGPDPVVLAEELAQTASHAWCFWIAPHPTRPALLISGDWNLSPFFLLGMFSRVDVWETDEHRAAVIGGVAAETGAKILVHHVPAACIADRLAAIKEPYGLAAMQDALGLIPRRSRKGRSESIRGLAAAASEGGQCCVVGRNRFACSGGFGAGYALPTPREVRREWSSLGITGGDSVFFHPDHCSPREVLFTSRLLPQARRHQRSMRLLERAGIVENLLGSFASFLPLQRGSLFLDLALKHWCQANLIDRPAKWVDCSVRENAMMFLSAGFDGGDEVVLRVPLLREAVEALERSDAVYADLARSVPEIFGVVPQSSGLHNVCGWPVHIERKLRGRPARVLIRNSLARTKLRREVSDFAAVLCEASLSLQVVDERFVETHYRSRFRDVCEAEPHLSRDLLDVQAAATALLIGRRMPTVRIHGDLTVNNVFFDAASLKLAGVIDWETSLPESLPFDLIHYLVSEYRELDPQPWGSLVARAIAGELLDQEAMELLLSHFETVGLEEALLPPLLVGYWIRGVALRQKLSGGRLAAKWQEANLSRPLASIKKTFFDARSSGASL